MARPKLTNLERAIGAVNKANEEVGKVTQQDILNVLVPIFLGSPDIEKISWIQNTPSFNDGAPCVFYSGHYYPSVKRTEPKEEGVEEEEDEWMYDEESANNLPGGQLFSSIPEDVMESVFGDHVRVIVNRNLTVDTEEYYD